MSEQVYFRVTHRPPQTTILLENGFYTFNCPHCGIGLEVQQTELNCQIFRCGVLKASQQPVPPHAPKTICDQLVADKQIWGCAKPFKFDGKTIHFCGYI